MRNLFRAVLRCVAALALHFPLPLRRNSRSRCTTPCSSPTITCSRARKSTRSLRGQYYGKPVNFVLHKNSELGLEKDYFAFINDGISVDYGCLSPADM